MNVHKIQISLQCHDVEGSHGRNYPHDIADIRCSCGYNVVLPTWGGVEISRAIRNHKIDVIIEASEIKFIVENVHENKS